MDRHLPWSPGGTLPLLVLVALSQFACMGTRVAGGIAPGAFQFTNVLPHQGGPREPGGWKAAQVLILLGHLSPLLPDASTCDIEVGMRVTRFQTAGLTHTTFP